MRPKAVLAGFVAVVALAALAGIRADDSGTPSPPPSRSGLDCGNPILKANGQPWRCTFTDDFDGRTLNPKRWGPTTTAMNDLQGQGDCWISNPANVAVRNGHLRLTTRRLDAPFACTTSSGQTFPSQVTSGSVSTYGLFAQAFGRWEVRARFPRVATAGSHGAIWLYPQTNVYGPWPTSGEIDIAEQYSLYPDRVIPNIHYSASFPDPTVTNNACLVSEPWRFHTYALVWTRKKIVITIDGAPCVDHTIHPAAPLTGPQPFDRPFVITLTQALGVGPNAATPATPFPLTTEIDYVRVWS